MKHPVPPKGNARHIAHPENTRNPIRGTTAKPSRRKLLCAGVGLAAVGTVPVATEATSVPPGDVELIRLADLAADACRGYCANLSDEVDIPAEVEAELDRWSALERDCYRRAAEIPATTAAGRRAKARIVALANSHNLACAGGDIAFVTLESLLDDLIGGEGSAAAFERGVNRRDGAL